PADRRDRDLRHGLEEVRDLLPELCPGRGTVLVDAAHVPDVGAGTEGAVAGPGEHDGTDVPVADELEQLAPERRHRRHVRHVEAVRAVHRDDCDRAVDARGNAHTLAHRRRCRPDRLRAPIMPVRGTPVRCPRVSRSGTADGTASSPRRSRGSRTSPSTPPGTWSSTTSAISATRATVP